MLAVLGGHTDCVHFLLEKGALPDTKDKRGRSALHRGVRPKRQPPARRWLTVVPLKPHVQTTETIRVCRWLNLRFNDESPLIQGLRLLPFSPPLA